MADLMSQEAAAEPLRKRGRLRRELELRRPRERSHLGVAALVPVMSSPHVFRPPDTRTATKTGLPVEVLELSTNSLTRNRAFKLWVLVGLAGALPAHAPIVSAPP